MSRQTPPTLRHHKPSQQGVVTLSGHDHYLGRWPAGTKKPPAGVRDAYDALVAEWLAGGRWELPRPRSPSPTSCSSSGSGTSPSTIAVLTARRRVSRRTT